MQDRRRHRITRMTGRLGRRLAAILLMPLILAACNDEKDSPPTSAVKSKDPAEITLNIHTFRYEFTDGRHRYHHVRDFVESAGTGATITKGRVCVEQGRICVEAVTDYRIAAKGRFRQSQSFFATALKEDQITLEYWITDDSGREHILKRDIHVSDGTARLQD